MPSPNWDLPLPNYERDINRLIRTYKNAIKEVLIILESLSTYGKEKDISKAQMEAVLAQLSVLLRDLDKETESWVKEQVTKAFQNGQAESVIAAGEAKTLDEAAKLASMSALVTQTLQAMIDDTFEDLLYANQKMKRETVKMVRAVVAEQMRTKAAEGMGRNTTRNAIVQALTKKELRERFDVEGNVAIIDKAGRRWKLETYAEMVTRTKMLQAHVEGTRVEALERGIDLAIISSHGAKDACRWYEGQIISMNGQTEGFLKYEDLRKSNLIFHPNCKHKITPIRDISLLPESVQKKFEEGQSKAKQALSEVGK
ncbi:phage minor capsid protein [Terrihalobacillus insolitus]|uniref:phage minor capsid protein n=1 Tax=Terrihalobacillus insolitus TaxID=2950438 RepID=UPI0023400DC0|nr:phage minor capsid protein [Terrihalobacillus insolitus]MDC3413970.1 phage minor capsid protein [Terrihalobacillus insolitus]